eukprot:6242673-Pyramimonas_sp.AAC.1
MWTGLRGVHSLSVHVAPVGGRQAPSKPQHALPTRGAVEAPVKRPQTCTRRNIRNTTQSEATGGKSETLA